MSGNDPEKDHVDVRHNDDGLSPEISLAIPRATMSTTIRKQPPPEKPVEIRRRSLIILSFWLFVLFLGLPIWWKTTSIYRANLPVNEMVDWADGKVIAICAQSDFRDFVPTLTSFCRSASPSFLSESPLMRPMPKSRMFSLCYSWSNMF